MDDRNQINPIKVLVDNWPKWPERKRRVNKTTVKTFIVAASGSVQIADYEPNRVRLAIYSVDGAVSVSTDKPVNTPDVDNVSTAPQGAYLPKGLPPIDLCGPDAFWLNSLGTASRVVVIKEYQ